MALALDILAGLVVAWAVLAFVVAFSEVARGNDRHGCAAASMVIAVAVVGLVALCRFFGGRFFSWIGSWAETPTLL